jgi:hypothetical protein
METIKNEIDKWLDIKLEMIHSEVNLLKKILNLKDESIKEEIVKSKEYTLNTKEDIIKRNDSNDIIQNKFETQNKYNFKNTILIVVFNYSNCINNKDILKKIYKDHFKQIIFYSDYPIMKDDEINYVEKTKVYI